MGKSIMKARWTCLHALLALCAMVLPGVGAAQATTPEGAAASPEAEQRTEQARERLKLTPEQEPQLDALVQTVAGKVRSIESKYGGNASREARINRASELRAVQQEFRSELTKLLTPEQLKEWEVLREEAAAKLRARRAGKAS